MCNCKEVALNMPRIDYGIVMRALLNDESECGDLAIVKQNGQQCFLALLDVLGHGKNARKVALMARDYIEQNYFNELVDIMNGLHKHLRGTRGAVAAFIRFNICSGEISYVGIGNISVRFFGREHYRAVSKDGVIGYIMPKPEKKSFTLSPGDIMVMHSDGLKEHFDVSECKDLFSESAQNIAEGLLKRLWKTQDDASCIALKYIP